LIPWNTQDNVGGKNVKEDKHYTRQPLAPEERRLLDYFREELKYGEAMVIVRNGLPKFVKVATKDIKLD